MMLKTGKKLLFLCAGAIFIISANAQANKPSKVLVSIKPIALIAQAITEGLSIEVDTLLPANASPHQYSLRPSDIRQLREAEFLIWLGAEYEPYIAKPNKEQLALLTALDQNKLIRTKDEEHNEDKEAAGDHHHGQLDPHFWLDPQLAIEAASIISKNLATKYPENAETFNRNLEKFKSSVEAMDGQLEQEIKAYKNTPFLVYHRGYDYLFRHYQIIGQAGLIHEQLETGLSLRKLSQIKQSMETNPTMCLFHEPQFAGAPLPTFLKNSDSGIKQIRAGELDPIGIGANSYEELEKNLLNQLVKCFSANER